MLVLDKKIEELKVLISEDEIKEKLITLAENIEKTFSTDEEIYVICVLKGSVMFCTDLVKHFKHPIQMEFIRISSYGHESKSTNNLQAIDLTLPNLHEKNVLIVEDIIDTGLTARFLTDLFKIKHHPKKLVFTALLNKKCARQIEIEPDFYGFEIDDKFVVGYGLDYKGYYRNLPYIGYFPN
ncbi:TPA: hypoxanthine phosphoribosyltransferase [Candidatus Avigastranaerophilus faecigallinarum]|nr:hypoxanthine phosphoribosyltransferase [Candidatus Avigastranaerophilus faecigallinarum]